MTRAVLLALGLWLLAGCSDEGPAETLPAPDASAPALGRLVSVKGEVSLWRGGLQSKAQPGDVRLGDAVETGADGEATLTLGEGTVTLGPMGRFEVEAGGAGVTLELERGTLTTRGGGVAMSIGTPFGLTRLVQGAEVSISVGPDDATVEVTLGEVELTSKSGELTTLSAGQQGRFGSGLKELPAIDVVVLEVTARSERRAKGEKRAAVINPRKLPSLGEGDVLQVKGGRLVLSAKDSSARLSLLAGAQAVLGGAGRGGGVEQTALELGAGGLEVAAPGGQRTRVLVGAGVALESPGGGQFEVQRLKTGFQVTARAGDLTLEREGAQPVKVPGGSVATVQGSEATVAELSRETVQLPTRTAMKLYHSGLKDVSLTFDGPEGKPVRVVVAADATFKAPLLDGLVHARHVNVPVPRRGRLYWKILDGDQELDKGSVSISPEPKAQDLSRLRNEVPDGKDKTTIYFQDKPPVVQLTFVKAEGAASSKVVVYREGELTSPVAERTTADARVALAEGTLVEGKYLWSVTPLDAAGKALKGGRMNKLELQYDNAVPDLVIKSPVNGQAAGKTVDVAGVAPVGARVWVNGRALTLDDKARFKDAVPVPGSGRIVFRILNGGAEVYTVRSVRKGR